MPHSVIIMSLLRRLSDREGHPLLSFSCKIVYSVFLYNFLCATYIISSENILLANRKTKTASESASVINIRGLKYPSALSLLFQALAGEETGKENYLNAGYL